MDAWNDVSDTKVGQPEVNALSHVGRHDFAIDSRLHDDLIVSQTESEAYYSLNGNGKEIWELLATQTTVGEICAQLSKSHGLAPEDIEEDVLAFLNDLKDAGLLRLVG